MSINNSHKIIRNLLNEIADYKIFLKLIDHHKEAKIIELARYLVDLDNVKNTAHKQKYQITLMILKQSNRQKLPRKSMIQLYTVIQFNIIVTIEPVTLGPLLLSKVIN